MKNTKHAMNAFIRLKIIRILLFPLIILRRSLLKWKHALKGEVTENLKSCLVSDPVLRVDEFNGVFQLDVRSDLFARVITNGSYEPRLVSLCKIFVDPNRDVVDVGANIGFYTVLFANLVNSGRKVLAIEPAINAREKLVKNIALNNVVEKTIVFAGVVSDTNGSMQLKTIEGKEEYSSLGVMAHPSTVGDTWTYETVSSRTLVDLINDQSLCPGFIKVDTEGAEMQVFSGGRKVLLEARPVILSELSDFLLKSNGSSAGAVVELIRACDYDVFSPDGKVLKDRLDGYMGDIFCFPSEMKAEEKFKMAVRRLE